VIPSPALALSGRIENGLFVAETFGDWDSNGVAGRQQAGEQCAEREKRGGCEQTAWSKGVLHPVGEDGAEKAVKRKTDPNARCGADESEPVRQDAQARSRLSS
jgi:hypothetical protein